MIWERMTRNRKYGIVTIISLTVCREDDSKDNHKDLTLLLINGNNCPCQFVCIKTFFDGAS